MDLTLILIIKTMHSCTQQHYFGFYLKIFVWFNFFFSLFIFEYFHNHIAPFNVDSPSPIAVLIGLLPR